MLVSDDRTLLHTMDSILHDFSMCTTVCPDPWLVAESIREGRTDLLIVDLDAENAELLLQKLPEFQTKTKLTILAISAKDCAAPGVHVLLRKPVTPESGLRSLKAAYTRILRDYRKHARCAFVASVAAIDERQRVFPATITDIGADGMGLATDAPLQPLSTLSIRLRLPELGSEISIRARVVWTRACGFAGCEFVDLSAFDSKLLNAWLESRYRVKKPLVSFD